MRQTSQKITQKLIDRLPENDQFYRFDELRSLEFPHFVIRRISVELKRNLADSMNIPKTDWANTKADAVLDAWQQFINAIQNEARLPASYAKAVIETAVTDIVEMLVQPRKNVPDVIFGLEQELSASQISDRLSAVVVYRHFSVLLSKYLQKKEIDRLSKKRCADVITKADERLTSGYSPLNWAQMLEPLFILTDGKIDTNLLRLFFEDKNKPRIARKFDLMNTVLSRAELIEELSSPDLLDFEGYEDDQSSLFEDQPKSSLKADLPAPEAVTSEKNTDITGEEAIEEEEVVESSTDKSEADTVETEKGEKAPDEEVEFSNTAGKGFRDNRSPKEESAAKAVETDAENKEDNIEWEAETSDEQEEHSGTSEKSEKEEMAEVDIKEDTTESMEDSDDGSTPIWMRFMTDEEIEEYRKEQEAEGDDDGFIEDPIIDLTQDNASEKERDRLYNLLSADREMFVEKIFRGSDRAFEEAVGNIAEYSSWRDVSKYIEKDIFKRNLVDMYSEAAVDFTDQLQSYFMEKQNRNEQ